MKALIYRGYGGPEVLRLEDVEKPTPAANEVLVRVRAASINPLDWHFMRGKPYPIRLITGLRRPKATRIGVDVAGVVEAVGSSVTDLKVGDEVFGSCRGALAGYVCSSRVVRKPVRLTFEQAAAVNVAGLTALQSLRDKARVRAHEKVLINGAAGGVGTFAVQIAKLFGAEVTGVCSSRNLETVRALGADHVIDYAAEDFTRRGERYDVILDAIGNHPLADLRGALTPTGRYVAIGGPDGWGLGPLVHIAKVVAASLVYRNVSVFGTKGSKGDLDVLREMTESGKVTPLVERVYPLSKAAEAMRHLETGHARGKVVVAVSS